MRHSKRLRFIPTVSRLESRRLLTGPDKNQATARTLDFDRFNAAQRFDQSGEHAVAVPTQTDGGRYLVSVTILL